AAMAVFGASVALVDHTTWRVEPTRYRATDFVIEPDASAATYLWAAEALSQGKIDLGVPMEAFTQPHAAAAKVINMFPRMPAVLDGSQMQDAVPTLAAAGALADHAPGLTGLSHPPATVW